LGSGEKILESYPDKGQKSWYSDSVQEDNTESNGKELLMIVSTTFSAHWMFLLIIHYSI